MNIPKKSFGLHIGPKVRKLRQKARLTQADLATRLGLSQSYLSEIENGGGSFTAEQFLEILRLFNVPASAFAQKPEDETSDLQKDLVRFGASHLQENADTVPGEHDVTDVIREAIATADSPRLTTALAPVLVRNIERINLPKLALQLGEVGLVRRLAWLVENTLQALQMDRPEEPAQRRLYRRAHLLLETFREFLSQPEDQKAPLDVLDTGIRSKQTRAEVEASSSPISQRWRIVTALQPQDFAEALRRARVASA